MDWRQRLTDIRQRDKAVSVRTLDICGHLQTIKLLIKNANE